MADGHLIFKTALDDSGLIKGLGNVKGAAQNAFGVAAKSVTAVSAALTAGSVAGIKYNSTIENYTTSFEVMTGSADKAKDIVEQLKKMGANTPFELIGLADTTQLLMNYGFTADDAMSRMMMLGDISQGNAEKMNRIAMAYGQMSSAGKVYLEDIKQMIEAGFNPLNEISETTGESMASLYDRISKGTISVDEITASMQRSTSEGGKYFQSMEKQSQTFSGQISTLKDNAQMLLGEVVQPISDSMVDTLLPAAISSIEELSKAFEKNGVEGLIPVAGTMIANFITAAAEYAPQMANLAVRLIGSLVQGILDNLPQLLEAAGEIASTILDGIGDLCPALTPVTDALQFIIDNMEDVLAVIVPLTAAFVAYKIAVSIAGILNGLRIAILAVNAAIAANPIGFILLAITAVVSALIYLWNTNEGFREAVTNAWNMIKETAEAVFGAIVDFFTVTIPDAISNVIEWFQNLPENISIAWDNLILDIQKFVSNLWSNLVQGVSNVISNVVKFFNELPYKIGYALGLAIGKVIQFGADCWKWATVELPKIIGGIVDWFASLPGKIWDWLLQTAFKVYLWGEDIKKKAREAVTGFIDNAITTIKELPGKIWEWLVKTALKVLAWKDDLTQKAKEAISSLCDKVEETIKDLPEKLKEAGINVAMGFYNGIKEKIDWVKEKVGGFFSGIADGVKDVLDIHSPSKLSQKFGVFFAQGFPKGVKKVPMAKQVTKEFVNTAGTVKRNLEGMGLNIAPAYGAAGNGTAIDYGKMGAAVATAFERSGFKVQIGNRELGRIMREVLA